MIRLPNPHPGQRIVRQQARRFNVLAAGRRWRKTTLVMSLAVMAAVRGKTVLWGAPTYDQVRIGWDETRRAAGGEFVFTQQRMSAECRGGRILYRSLDDPDNARGHTADLVIIDEAGDVRPEAWYEVLRPMLIDTGGKAWLVGTPRGHNWFWREWMGATDRSDAISWRAPVVGCEIRDGELIRKPHPLENPFVPFEEIQNIFETTPESVFRQEILAEFVEREGAVFRNVLACLGAPENARPEDHTGHFIVMGVDWGKQQDFTALSVVCGTCKQELALDRFNQIDYAFQRGRLAALAGRWGVAIILAEQNAMGEPIVEQLQRDGLPVRGFQTTATSKPPLIENLALSFERREYQWLDVPIATAELMAYERKVSKVTGRSTYGAPEGVHDDTVMARALALWALSLSAPVQVIDNPFYT